MMHIDWQPEMRVGHARLDVERQCLIVAVNAAIAYANKRPDTNAITPRLVILHDMAADYFAHEENVMRESGFPLVNEHAQEHLMLLRLLEARREIVGILQNETRERAASIPDLATFLRNWLTDHLLGKDWRFQHFLKDRNAESKPHTELTFANTEIHHDS